MTNKTPKTRFWIILVTANILALIYPLNLLLGSNDDASRLLGVMVMMVGVLLLFIADSVSIVFAYWS